MKTSLIVSTFNNPVYLERVFESILTQTARPDEMLIADDGSGEETAWVVKRYAETAPFPVLHVWHEDRGFRAAKIRNEAIKRASGEYLLLLDGDCIVNRHFVSDHLSLAETSHFIQGKRALVSKRASGSFTHEQANSLLSLAVMALTGRVTNIHHLLRLRWYPPLRNRKLKNIKSCNMSFFRRDILAVNGFNEDYVGWGNEDSDLACRFFKYGLTKKVHPFMAVCFHLWHPTNKSVTSANEALLMATIASEDYVCKNGIIKEN